MYTQLKVCSGPLYPWQDIDPCLDLDRLLWQIILADVLKVVFEQVQASRSTPGLGWWLLPYIYGGFCKVSMRLD